MNNVYAVVVTYNKKELLLECVEALLVQTYQNLKILVIDNASTNGSREYIDGYLDNEKVIYYNTEENLGGGQGALTTGLRLPCRSRTVILFGLWMTIQSLLIRHYLL